MNLVHRYGSIFFFLTHYSAYVRFGKVLNGEINLCRRIAQQTGVLLDPIYTLAAWEHAVLLADAEAEIHAKVVMLHTGGTLGLFGLSQRYRSDFFSGVPTVHTS
ncbi:hypothetical protein GW17_00017320 [Ensete ventricosum]|nr:hypothetical protein GW17_00017320 [Ensete ventricosum]